MPWPPPGAATGGVLDASGFLTFKCAGVISELQARLGRPRS